jgi:hypothetical protein
MAVAETPAHPHGYDFFCPTGDVAFLVSPIGLGSVLELGGPTLATACLSEAVA